MKIDIKVTEYSPSMSEETYCFMADVLVNGKLVAQAKNYGHGGNTSIVPYSGKGTLLAEAEAYCRTLPAFDIGFTDGIDGPPVTVEQDLELVVDNLFDKYVREVYIPAKETKRYKRMCKDKTIYILHSDEGKYERILSMQYSPTVAAGIRKQHAADLKEIINERFTAQPVKK